MATVSFTKEFSITKRETVERLEKKASTDKPLRIDSKNVITNMKRSEDVLLRTLRSKA